MAEPMIQLKNIHKTYGSNEVLKGVDLTVNKGEVVTLIGPSGTGKTTLLRCVNLLEKPEQGTISIGSDQIDCAKLTKKETVRFRRHSTMVFQNYCLFKNKTVLENVTEGLIVAQKKSMAQAKEIALEELKKVNMLDKLDSYPSEISGGQQQRVGIARALALRPEVILLDEPTSALDPELVGGVLEIIRGIAQTGITMMIVTHEIKFARDISTKVVFLDGGKVVEEGTPQDIFEHAREERTVQFLKKVNR